MEKYHYYFLIIHVTAGMISLVVAPIAFMTLKGGSAHRLWGKIYFWCMAVVAVTAIIMSIYHHLAFLLMIAVFSFSSALRGYRSIYLKLPGKKRIMDWGIEIANGLVSVGLIIFGAYMYRQGMGAMSAVPQFFGIFGLRSSVQRMKRFVNPPTDKKVWLYEHIGNMSGSYIASVTAFLVNTAHFLPAIVAWLAPAVIGLPLIYFTVQKYKKKFSNGEKVKIVESA